MRVRADFRQSVEVQTRNAQWAPSPMAGVDRIMLDRIGEEVARATSVVRYAPGSHFSPHTHGGGEEFLVLEGVFQDEQGDYPAGTYVRNPPGSSHTPASQDGCTILVKLWQFRPDDLIHSVHTLTGGSQLLFDEPHERVEAIHIPAGQTLTLDAQAGCELFHISGSNAGLWQRRWTDQPWMIEPDGRDRLVWRKSRHFAGRELG